MAFIISKKSITKGEERFLYYLVENYRENNKVKRRKLLTLGACKNLTELLEIMERRHAGILLRLAQNENRLKNFLSSGKNPFPFVLPTDAQQSIKERLIATVERTKVELEEFQSKKERVKSLM